MTPRDAIEAADTAEAETAYRHQLARESYQAGVEDGYRAGVTAARGEMDADRARWWRDRGQRLVREPSHAELEERRWGPAGREHFADARPGDFPGRCPRTEPAAEPELEAVPW